MTLKRLFLYLAAAAVFATACSQKEQQPAGEDEKPSGEADAPAITLLSQSSVVIPDDAYTFAVEFASNYAWKATSSAKWLTFPEDKEGEAGENLSLSVKSLENASYSDRNATITITCSNDGKEASATVSVTQKYKGALVIETASPISVACEGGNVSIKLKSNSEVSFEINGSAAQWISYVAPKAELVESTYEFLVAANEGEDPREGVITFTNDSGSEDVTISQAAPEILVIENDYLNFTFAHEGGTATVPVKSNGEVSFEISQGSPAWLSYVEPKSAVTTEYTFVGGENYQTVSRSATVTFTLGEKSIVVTFTQEAAPDDTPENVVNIATAADFIAFAQKFNGKGYDGIADLQVKLLDDIVFDATSSMTFNSTGGIGLKEGANGQENYYFPGVFDGCSHSISGLSASVPLFVAIDEAGSVKNLTLGSDCTFTFVHAVDDDGHFGPVAGYNKGLIQNVSVSSSVSLASATVNKATCLGGIAGRVTIGTVDGCTFNGAISVPADFKAQAQKIQIGGIVGRVSNADGKIKACIFSGTIDNQGQMIAAEESSDMKNNPQLLIGGVAGLNSGSIENCVTENHPVGITVILTDTSDHPITGSIVTHSTNAYHYALGGIAARNDGTVASCNNKSAIVNIFHAERGASGNMNGRYLEVGGIVAFNGEGATVSGCFNNGPIIDRANPKIHYIGGVVGKNHGSVLSCDNNAEGAVAVGTSYLTPYSARMPYIGGVIAYNASSGIVANVHNAAAINLSRYETTSGVMIRVGGVIGMSEAEIDGSAEGGSISNSGSLSQSNAVLTLCSEPSGANDYGFYLGGVVGYATAGVKNVSNSGAVKYTCNAAKVGVHYVYLGGVVAKLNAASAVDVLECHNTANVTFAVSEDAQCAKDGHAGTADDPHVVLYDYIYMGGVAGYAKNAAIKDSDNSGAVKGGDSSANNNRKKPSFMVGGIVGYVTGTSSISGCTLAGEGRANNDHFSNRGFTSYDCPAAGGIAGQVVGADGALIAISDCEVESTASVISRRGACGGIVGMAQYASVSQCKMPLSWSSGSAYFYGGIVALAQNSSINSCSYDGSEIKSSQIQIGGGITALLDAGTVVDGCSSKVETIDKNGTPITAYGAVAGQSVAGSAIKNCHYKNGVQICSDANFTGTGNVADL